MLRQIGTWSLYAVTGLVVWTDLVIAQTGEDGQPTQSSLGDMIAWFAERPGVVAAILAVIAVAIYVYATQKKSAG